MAAILDLEGKIGLKRSKTYFIVFILLVWVENDTLFITVAHVIPEIGDL